MNFPTTDSDSSLHTQLWIDPAEEFVQYTHTGDPIDVTFGVKELKVSKFNPWDLIIFECVTLLKALSQ